jgi:hypothetical protein
MIASQANGDLRISLDLDLLIWKASWVHSPRGFESRILRRLKTGSDFRKRTLDPRCREQVGLSARFEACAFSLSLSSKLVPPAVKAGAAAFVSVRRDLCHRNPNV